MASYVNGGAFQSNAPASSLPCALGWNPVNGNALIVVVGNGNQNANITVTDNKGNTYTEIEGISSSYIGVFRLFADFNITGGSSTTITVNGTGTFGTVALIQEFSGLQSAEEDISDIQASTNQVQSITTPAAVRTTDTLVIGMFAGQDTTTGNWSVGSGFSNFLISAQTGASGANGSYMMEHKFVTNLATQTATVTHANVTGAVGIVTLAVAGIPDLPTVTTQAASSVDKTTATLNGNVTAEGDADVTMRGFVYGTSSVGSDPGNVAPGSSGYSSNTTESGSYSTGSYNLPLTSLTKNTTYYARAVAQSSVGYSYGSQVNFTTLPGTPLIDAISETDAGFVNLDNGGDTHPFTTGDDVEYTVQTPLAPGTYYWRVRVTDATGSDTFSSYTTTRSFTVSAGGSAEGNFLAFFI